MEGVTKRSFSINLTALRLLGLYPQEKHTCLYLGYGCLFLSFCLIPDPLFSFLYFFKVEGSNMMDAGFNLFLLPVMLCFIPKLLPFIINHKKIRECLYYLETSVHISLNEKQKKMVDECVRVCRRNSIFFFVCIIIDGLTWSTRPLFSEKRVLPMDVWLPFDPTANTAVFYFVYISIAAGVVYTGVTSASIDPLVGGLAYHAAGQIMVLKDNLQNLHEYVNLEIASKNLLHCAENDVQRFRIIYKKIRQCIEHHNAILTFVQEIENCFSLVVFSQFVGSIVIICFCCLQLSKSEMGVTFVLMLIYLCSALIQIYFYCYYGTTLYEESNTLTTAAYMGQWYEYDTKSKKALIIFMGRSNISMTVTAGKVFNLSLETFTMILRRSYSLLAVLENY